MSLAILSPSNPGAGNNLTITVPANTYYFINAMKILFTTDATVATRYVSLSLDDGANQYFSTQGDVGQAASLATSYCFAPRIPPPGTAGGTTSPRVLAIPSLILSPGHRILIQASGIVAGDAFTEARLHIETNTGEFYLREGRPFRLSGG